MHSAKKIDGKRLFKLARQGQVVERDPIPCHIKEFKVFYMNEYECAFKVSCSAGTFIRVLAENLGETINTVAHLKSLRRTQSGNKNIQQAWTLAQLEECWMQQQCWTTSPAFFPVEDLVRDWPIYNCNEVAAQSVRYGRNDVLLSLNYTMPTEANKVAMMIGSQLLAIAEKNEEGRWKYNKVLEGR